MLPLIVLSIIYVLTLAQDYKKLYTYSSVKVIPDTRVYLDISSYDTGELIQLQLSMDLFFGDSSNRKSYTFQIGQVSTSYYADSYSWKNLPNVTNRNVSCTTSEYCYFKWNETKQYGKKYIFIIPPTPFPKFYNFWGNYIKVSHLGGLSAGAIVGIVFGCIGAVVLLIIIIYCCCCRSKKIAYIPTTPPVTITNVQPIIPVTVQPIAPAPVVAPVQPIPPTYCPPPPQPYVSPY